MRRLLGLIAAIACSLSTPCFAQGIGMDITSTTSELRPEQRALLEQFVNTHVKGLAGDNLDVASKSRSALLGPLRSPGATALFRDEYSRILTPQLQPLVSQDDNPFAAVNAMQIAAQLKTQEAMRLALDHVRMSSEPRTAVRVMAAIAVRQAAVELAKNQVFARAVDQATRDLARAAREETEWLVLLREFEALASIGTPVAQTEELQVLKAVASRMAKEAGPSELIHAVFPAVISLRDRMLDTRLSASQLAEKGKNMAPVLGEVLAVADRHFDSAQQSEESRQTYGKLVAAIDQTITRIDKIVAPAEQATPTAQLREAWEKKDKARFNQGVQQWQKRFETAAYKP